MRPHLLLAAVPVLCAASCGSGAQLSRCSGMVSGKVTGTFSVCNALDQRYLVNLDEFSLTAAFTELPTSFVLDAVWRLRGEPDSRVYAEDQSNVDCRISVKKGTPEWLSSKGAGLPSSGTCALDLAEVHIDREEGNVITYQAKGTMTARLEAVPGTTATEAVNLQMTFCQGDLTFCPAPDEP